jgi:hypothetical protein
MTNFLPVKIEIDELCRQLSADAGRPVCDIEAVVWLRDKGFVHFGDIWMGDEQCQRSLLDLQKRLIEPIKQ